MEAIASRNFQQLLLLAALVVCLQNLVSAFDITDCSGDKAATEVTKIAISSCPDRSGSECIFHKGESSTLTVDFKATKSFSQANIAIYSILGPTKTKFIFDGPTDACGNYGFNCPTKAGSDYQLEFSLPVPKYAPKIKAKVQFTATDESQQNVICFEFPVKIEA